MVALAPEHAENVGRPRLKFIVAVEVDDVVEIARPGAE